MFRISTLLALLAFTGVAAQEAGNVTGEIPSYCADLPEAERCNLPACCPGAEAGSSGNTTFTGCNFVCCLLPSSIREFDPNCGSEEYTANCGECESVCRPSCCDVVLSNRKLDISCSDWIDGDCGECETPSWCYDTPKKYRCDTAICCENSGAGNLNMNAAFAIIAGFVALFMKDFVF
jgi:hypothetical protein